MIVAAPVMRPSALPIACLAALALALAACRTADDVVPDVLTDPFGTPRAPDGAVTDRPDAASTDLGTVDAAAPDAD